MDRPRFIQQITDRFPEVVTHINHCSRGLLHCEMADFRHAAEAAMDAGNHWRVE